MRTLWAEYYPEADGYFIGWNACLVGHNRKGLRRLPDRRQQGDLPRGDRRPAKVIVSSDTADDFAACFWAISAISRETRLRAPFCRDGKVLLQEPKVAAVRLMVKHTKPEF